MIYYFVYVLFSDKDKKLYIGYSTDLKERIKSHFSGKVTSTKEKRPLSLIHYEVFTNKNDAKTREKYLKSGYGRQQLTSCLRNALLALGYEYVKSESEDKLHMR